MRQSIVKRDGTITEGDVSAAGRAQRGITAGGADAWREEGIGQPDPLTLGAATIENQALDLIAGLISSYLKQLRTWEIDPAST